MKLFRALDEAVEFYHLIETIELHGHLRDQLHRAASSISLNLSEGNARGSAKDKRHFFQTSYASLRECQVIFRLLKLQNAQVEQSADRLGGMLYKLINSEIKNSPSWRPEKAEIRATDT